MNMYIALGPGESFDNHFPPAMLEQLRALGTLRIQGKDGLLTEAELIEALQDTDVLLSHWGTPRVTEAVLDACPQLSVIAHCAGSVAGICSPAVFDRGLTVLSANWIMSEYVAEAILGYLIGGLRHVTQYDRQMKQGVPNPRFADKTLIGAPIAFIGLGMVGRHLLDMLAPLHPEVRVYDPYITEGDIAAWPFARRTSMDEALRGATAVSLHAAKTPETYHLVDAKALSLLPDGALVVNAARGAVMDTDALVAELRAGRLYAVLDVYEKEPLAVDSPLRTLENVVLMPHKAGLTAKQNMTQGIIEELRSHQAGKPLTLTISRRQYELMTQE